MPLGIGEAILVGILINPRPRRIALVVPMMHPLTPSNPKPLNPTPYTGIVLQVLVKGQPLNLP